MYLLRLAFRPWRSAPLSQFFSAVAVGVVLVLTGLMAWVETGMKPVLERLKAEQVITAYLSPTVPAAEEEKLSETIRAALGAPAVSDLSLVRAQQFVENVKGQYPELSEELLALGPELEAIVPRYVSVTGLFDEGALDRVKAITGVEAAESSKDRYQHILSAFAALRWVARLFVMGLVITLISGFIHLSNVNALRMQDALSFFRLWGAGRWAMHAPGMLAGLSVGCMGGLFAAWAWLSGGRWLVRVLRDVTPAFRDIPGLTSHWAGILLLIGVLLGALSGLLAGLWQGREQASGRTAAGGRAWV